MLYCLGHQGSPWWDHSYLQKCSQQFTSHELDDYGPVNLKKKKRCFSLLTALKYTIQWTSSQNAWTSCCVGQVTPKMSLGMVFLTFTLRIKWYLMLQLLSGFTAGWKFFSPIMSQSHDLELRSWPLTTFLYKVWHILSSTQGLRVARNYVHVCHTSWFKKGLVPSIQVGPQQRWIVWRSEWMNEWTQFLLQPVITCFFTL